MTKVPSATVIKVNRSLMRKGSCCHLKRFGFGAGFSEIRMGSKTLLLLPLPVGVYIKIKTQTLDCIENHENWSGVAI